MEGFIKHFVMYVPIMNIEIKSCEEKPFDKFLFTYEEITKNKLSLREMRPCKEKPFIKFFFSCEEKKTPFCC